MMLYIGIGFIYIKRIPRPVDVAAHPLLPAEFFCARGERYINAT